ncbi:MAG TPA: oxidoreductase [Mycobacteriales bacterium]|nr:oxidoreductase [Mycobacteriales bacterium]
MSRWTAKDIPPQTGRVAVVTGANSGLGLATSRELARAGATVVMGCRDASRGAAAVKAVREQVPEADLDLQSLDLASLASIGEFAQRVAASYDGIDLLINNAGVMAIPRATTADGFEMQFGTNHLGHFALTGQLLPSIRDRAGSRIVTVSSTAHKPGRINFDDLMSERSYRKWQVYSQSKLANLLFAYELQRRLAASGAQTISVAAHPGYAATNLQAVGPQQAGNRVMGVLMNVGNWIFAQSADMGALPQLYAATAPGVHGGEYFGPSGFQENRGHPKKVDSRPRSKNTADAARLWQVSQELTGVRFLDGQ